MSDEARSLELERRRAQRLEVASRMARGIRRELVDLVTVIRGHASLLVEAAERMRHRRSHRTRHDPVAEPPAGSSSWVVTAS